MVTRLADDLATSPHEMQRVTGRKDTSYRKYIEQFKWNFYSAFRQTHRRQQYDIPTNMIKSIKTEHIKTEIMLALIPTVRIHNQMSSQ
ncbi:hypothetical protein AAHA92_30563 [Salvia divinorum]|uniref:Uncharacterized protein n=1 Tax=Salvia divinorum TaxID=28513 RepID=A0ABD1FS96_SALDI